VDDLRANRLLAAGSGRLLQRCSGLPKAMPLTVLPAERHPVGEPRSRLAACRRLLLRAGACGVVAGVLGLAAPGVARAADPFGTDQIQAEVDAALAEAEAEARVAQEIAAATVEAAAAEGGAVSTRQPASAPQPADPTAAVLEFAANEAAAATSSAGSAPAGAPAEPSVTAVTPLVLELGRPVSKPRARDARRAGPATAKRPHPRRIERAARSIELFTSSGHSFVNTVVVARATQSTSHVQMRRAPHARPTQKAPAGAAPQRPPPVPPGPGPDLTSSVEGGGQGLQIPLVVGALAAAALTFAFALLPRLLPRPAFRKPRLFAHLPWHPG